MERVVRHRHDRSWGECVCFLRGGCGVGVCFVGGDAREAGDGPVGDAEGFIIIKNYQLADILTVLEI